MYWLKWCKANNYKLNSRRKFITSFPYNNFPMQLWKISDIILSELSCLFLFDATFPPLFSNNTTHTHKKQNHFQYFFYNKNNFRQFFGEPIQCDAGSQSDGVEGDVLNSYCWMYSMWNIPPDFKEMMKKFSFLSLWLVTSNLLHAFIGWNRRLIHIQ